MLMRLKLIQAAKGRPGNPVGKMVKRSIRRFKNATERRKEKRS